MRKSETYRNEIKSYIVRTGMTMTEVVDYLSTEGMIAGLLLVLELLDKEENDNHKQTEI